ncbi:transcript variant X4 [Nothobranchius furzeri]|uniref:Transcript variant X4 n=1 Tax=Nothobranchius furzeri TaxID=105023 RepID=A0A9D2Z2M0_NOTFU|nr:transcript variant X4 [Nothobranchius furzeri]
MRITVFISQLLLLSCCITKATKAGDHLEADPVRSQCRDRYLWIQVASALPPHFKALGRFIIVKLTPVAVCPPVSRVPRPRADEDRVHLIDQQLASRCGYTISTIRKEGFTIFRASFFSCFTRHQNNEFTFRFNVMVSDGGGRWSSWPVSALCPGPSWTHREITCEENFMEVNLNRGSSCGGQGTEGGQVWQKALFQAQRTASLAWQLMFLQSNGQTIAMSVPEAQTWGYTLVSTTQRVVLRSPYKQPHADVTMVAGVPVEVVQVSLFFKQKLMLVMMDMSMACIVDSSSFDGTQLLWDIPQVLPTLAGEGARFESQRFSLGLDGVLLDKDAAASRGLRLAQQGGMVKIGIPFGAEGGFRKSLVEGNVYKEVYVIPLMYEHVFSLVYEDGNSIDTRHRILKVLETPLISRLPFCINKTVGDHQQFWIYLGNIPADVLLEGIRINEKQMLVLGKPEGGLSISPIVHENGSRAYDVRLPFNDAAVDWTNEGGGVVLYSINMNFTLNTVPQKDVYYHQASVTARVFDAFPPEVTAKCLDGGISFSVVRPSLSLWEVGIGHEPLTAELVSQRGYHLTNDSHRTILDVPLFSVGYTYEEINLANFYATFKLLLRDSKTLEIQASASKRCLFRTEDMIVCSADGTMTVVANPASTWPTVQPERTSLLDRTCKPKQTDGVRVLFEFNVNSCGTKAMAGDWYVVYENEILHDRLLIADGPNFISREPQFKVTARCFYPLSAINRLSVDRTSTSKTPGFGSVRVYESLRATGGTLTQLGPRPGPNLGSNHFLTEPAEPSQPHSSPNQDRSSERQTNQLSQSSDGEAEAANPVEQMVHVSPFQHKSPQTHQLHPIHQWDHIRNELPHSRKHETLASANSQTSLSDWSRLLQESFHHELPPAASGDVPGLEWLRSVDGWNAQTRVQNIRVKPPSRFVSSGPHLNQKSVVQPAHSQNSGPSQYSSGLIGTRGDQNQWTSQKTKHGGSSTGEERVLERLGTLEQTRPEPPSLINFTYPSPNKAVHQSSWVQLLAEIKNGRREHVSFHTPGASHVRLPPAGLPALSESGNRMFHQSHVQHLPAGAGSTPLVTYAEGSDSQPKMQRLACGAGPDPYEASVHEGLVRGTATRHPHHAPGL